MMVTVNPNLNTTA